MKRFISLKNRGVLQTTCKGVSKPSFFSVSAVEINFSFIDLLIYLLFYPTMIYSQGQKEIVLR